MSILIIIILFESIDLIRNKNKIYTGITVLGMPLEGLTMEEARLVLEPVVKKITDSNRVLVFENEKIIINPGEHLQSSADLSVIIKNAYNVCRNGNIVKRIGERISVWKNGYEVPFEVDYSEKKLLDLFKKIDVTISRVPEEAKLEAKRIIESVTGIKLDREKFKNELIENLNCIDDTKYEINISVTTTNPDTSTLDILGKLGIKHRLADYSTSIEGKEKNTIYNIALASEMVNGIIIEPESIFSFNHYVGPAEKEDGYKESTIIANGKFVNGYGGGVCQVASTLYNALILGNFEIVQRYNHSVYGDATKYVPLGRDSGIFFGYKDLKFKNNYSDDIVIFVKVMGDTLRVVILGEEENNSEIEIISKDKKIIDYEIIREKDIDLGKGQEVVAQEGVNGYEIKTYRVVRQNGEEKIELLSSDVYKSVPMIIKEN
ncbi:MAG: VanW family protein [Candidatus Caldatribacteriota bacterium]|nr:VanW family protein [Candidatus Caldatribacteriota bacterium]